MCGKDTLRVVQDELDAGSPPRVRERLIVVREELCLSGITPACAGKTQIRIEIESIDEDHPRVCGKDDVETIFDTAEEGSPPRVRERHSETGKF